MSLAVQAAIAAIKRVPPTSQSAPELRPAWAVLDARVRRYVRAVGRREDVQQDALVRVLRNVHACAAASPNAADRWVERVVRSTEIDAARAARVEPVEIALRGRGRQYARHLDVEVFPCGSVPLDAPEQLIRELEAALDRHLAATVRDVRERAAHRLHARARLHRKLGASVDGVRRALAWGHVLSDDLVSKWIERGRGPLDGAVRVWIDDDPEGRAGIGRTLRARFGERRGDAGIARAA